MTSGTRTTVVISARSLPGSNGMLAIAGKVADGCRRRADDRQRVAVRRRFCRAVDTQHAARAADVLDHDRLAELRAHALREKAAENVRRAAHRKRHDQAQGFDGIGCAPRGASQAAKTSTKHRIRYFMRAIVPAERT